MNETLPPPYIFEIDTPLLYFNGRLLQPKNPADIEDNYAEFYGTRFSLEEIASPKALEDLYFRHNKELIDKCKESFSKHHLNQEFKSKEAMSREIRRNKELSLIVEKILPVITAERMVGRIEELLLEDDDNPKERRISRKTRKQAGEEAGNCARKKTSPKISSGVKSEIESMKKTLIGSIDREYRKYELGGFAGQSDVDEKIKKLLVPFSGYKGNDACTYLKEKSIFSGLVGNRNLMIIEDRIYSLITINDFLAYFKDSISTRCYTALQKFLPSKDPAEIIDFIGENKASVRQKYYSRIINKIENSRLKINNMYYLPLFWDSAENLMKRYSMMIEKQIKIDAVNHSEFQSEALLKIAKEKARLESIASRSSFERNHAGFEIHNGSYYVYVVTPKYAMRSPHVSEERRYVPFEPAKIGVRIKYHENSSGRGAFQIDSPVVMHSYTHPFLGNASAYKSICLGSSYGVESRTGGMSPERKAIALLDQGKKTLMMGYKSGSNPYRHLYKSNWDKWLTKKEAERKGHVILNDWS